MVALNALSSYNPMTTETPSGMQLDKTVGIQLRAQNICIKYI